MIGVVFSDSLRVASLAGPSALANGSSSCSVGPTTAVAVASLPRPTPVLCSAPGSSCSVLLEARVLLGERREHGVGGVDQLRELLVLAAERFDQQAEVVDRARHVGVADFQLLGDLFGEAGGRGEALERGR